MNEIDEKFKDIAVTLLKIISIIDSVSNVIGVI